MFLSRFTFTVVKIGSYCFSCQREQRRQLKKTMISLRQFNAWFARSLYTFLLDGVLKAHGVIMEETVRRLYTQHYKIGVVFTLQSGICYLIGIQFNTSYVGTTMGVLISYYECIHTIIRYLCSVSTAYMGIQTYPRVMSMKIPGCSTMDVMTPLSGTLVYRHHTCSSSDVQLYVYVYLAR